MAQLVLGVAGAAIGSVFGPLGTSIGFALGSGLGGALEGPQRQQGPRLDDLKAPQASYGSPIPYVEGSPRVAGIFAWASEKREIATTEEVGGKGGGGVESTTYTYEIDVLYLLSINEVAGVRRIWLNGQLVWSQAADADDATLAASDSTENWRAIRVYTGAADQLPDPTYEAALGIGNAPAYRGRASVFIEGLQLGGSGQLPVLTFELVTVAAGTYRTASVWSAPIAGQLPDDNSLVGSIFFNGRGARFKRHRRLFEDALTVYDFEVRDGELVSTDSTEIDVSPGWLVPNLNRGFCDDQSLLLVLASAGSLLGLYQDDGQVTYNFSREQSGGVIHYCARGAHLVVTTIDADLFMRLTRFGRGGGGPVAESPVAISSQSGAFIIDDAFVYVLRTDSALRVDIYDLLTLDFVETIDAPSSNPSNTLSVDIDGVIYFFDASVWTLGADRTWQLLANDLGDAAVWGSTDAGGIDAGFPCPPVISGTTFYTVTSTSFASAGGSVLTAHAARLQLDAQPVPLDEVVSRACLRTGLLETGDIDATELSGKSVRAMAVTQITPTRTVLENLMRAYLFDCAEGEKLKFVLRGAVPALTVPFEDLGAYAGGEPPEPLQLIRRNDIELPAFVSVKFANVLNDFQDGLESSDRLATDSSSVQVIEIPLGLTPQEAKRIADVTAMDLAVSVLGLGPIALDSRYAALEPTDVVLLTGESGSTYRARFVKTSDAQGLRQIEPVIDDATIINSAALTDEAYTGSTIVRALADTDLVLLDIPILRDADNAPGFYAAAGAAGRWPGTALRRSLDAVDYSSEVASFTDRAVLGVALTALGDWTGGYVWDEVNTVTVNVGEGELTSTTREAIQLSAGLNVVAIGTGAAQELVQFRSASLVSAGVYTLSGLLRGRRGTEAYIAGHEVGDEVVLMRTTGLRRVEHQTTDIGLSRTYKAVTFGKSLAAAAAATFTDTGVALRPFSPTNARVSRNPSTGDAAITWSRRTRLAVRYGGAGGSYVPLGEASESYAVDVFADGTYASVVRTLTAASPSVAYSAADQTADFGAPQATLYLRIYQLSALVGRGTALEAAA